MTAPDAIDQTVEMPDPMPQSSGRWLRVALAISLAVNLGIAGIVAGAMLRRDGPMHGGSIARDAGFGPFTEALSIEDRGQLRRAFLASMPELRDGYRAMREDVRGLLTQLRAVPLDEDGLRAAFDRQKARNSDRLELGQRLIFDLVVGMTDEARQAFADRLEQSLAKRPKRRTGSTVP